MRSQLIFKNEFVVKSCFLYTKLDCHTDWIIGIRKFIGSKKIIINIYRIEAYDLITCGYFCIGFIDFMLKGQSLLAYTNSSSSSIYKKNYKIILSFFQ